MANDSSLKGLACMTLLGFFLILSCISPKTRLASEATTTQSGDASPDSKVIQPGRKFQAEPPPGLEVKALEGTLIERSAQYNAIRRPGDQNIRLTEIPTIAAKGAKKQKPRLTGKVGPATSPTASPAQRVLSDSFDSTDFDDNITTTGSVFIPPDCSAAAGPDHLVNVVNTTIRFHQKDGTLDLQTSLASFFAPLTPLNATFDPKVIYDQYEQRFVVVTLERTDTANGDPFNSSRVFVAVSDDANPNGSWSVVAFNTMLTIGAFPHWADYPGFAVDEEAVYIALNMFRFLGAGGSFGGTRLIVIDKGVAAGFYAGGAVSASLFDPYAGGGFAGTTQPAHTFDAPPAGVGTFLTLFSGLTDGVSEYIQVNRLDNPLTAPAFTNQFVNIGNIDDLAAALPSAPQLGTAATIETNDRRTLHAVWRNDSLWTTTTIDPKAGDPDAGEATAHWVEIDTTALGALSLADSGSIGGEDIAIGTHTSFPAIAVNDNGDATIGFSASASAIYPGAYFATRSPHDTAGTTGGSETLRAGLDFYIRTFGGTNRWGDYSGIAVDPETDCFWVYNEYALTRGTPTLPGPEDGRWGTAYGLVCPCDEEFNLTAGQWDLITLPCDTGQPNTVAEVFGDDLPIANYNTTWTVYERDEVNDQYIQMALGDILAPGNGYWIKTLDTGQSVTVEGSTNPVLTMPLEAHATNGRFNMMGHPFTFDVDWADVQVIDGPSTLTLAQADPLIGMVRACDMVPPDPTCVMSRTAFKWTGSAYESFDGITMGAEGTLNPFDGIWVKAFKSGISLRIPAIAAGPMAPPISKPSENSEWFVRLVARTGNLESRGTVLGQLHDSLDGFDAHDLIEFPPFGNPYLNIVFVHDDWAAHSGVYLTDYRAFDQSRKAKEWTFEVRSSQRGAVELSWEGDARALRGVRLLDPQTGKSIAVKPGGKFVFQLQADSKTLIWRRESP